MTPNRQAKLGIGVIGCGYWGPNLVRNFEAQEASHVVSVCDTRYERAAAVASRFRLEHSTERFEDVIENPAVDMVVVATPSFTHFDIARRALEAGKHVLVMKPLTTRADHAEELVHIADRKGVLLAVDHTFVYTGAVQKLRAMVEGGELGEIFYIDTVRINLGLFQSDVNVLWDLAPHDISIIDYLLSGQLPTEVAATGASHAGSRTENIAYLTLRYGPEVIAHVHVNWLAPAKVRRTIVGGSRRMVIYDDMEPSEKLKIYDKGVTITPGDADASYSQMVSYRSGDMHAPQLDMTEALTTEVRHLINTIRTGASLRADGRSGLRVVRILEAAEHSLRAGSRVIGIEAGPDARVAS